MLAVMPNYRRHYLPVPVFVTLVTHHRQPWITGSTEPVFEAMRRTKALYPFQHFAHVLLPDHIHWLFEPAGSANFSTIVATLKRDITWRMKECGVTERLWQARFYDHLIRDEADLQRHLDYIHFNPVKHGYCLRPQDWPHSSFHAWMQRGAYPANWGETAPGHIADMALE